MMTAVCLAKVRFDLMLLLLGVVARHPAADHAWLPDKVGSRSPAIFVGGFEDEASAQIKGEDARLLPAERRNKRGRGLRRRHNDRLGLLESCR